MFDFLLDFEAAVEFLSNLEWYWILAFAFFITMLENLFPPSPSDSILVFTGSLVTINSIGFFPLLFLATAGSVVGFVIMYVLGLSFGHRIIESEKFSFINKKRMERPERWFRKYGYYLIVANRFLSGTRAAIAFFAGISELDLTKTIILSAVSALIWNSLLIGLGMTFAENFEVILEYMNLYGKIIIPTIALIIIVYLLKIFWWDKRKKTE